MNDTVKVTIKNWEKFNPRKDVSHPSWFRCENSIFENIDFFDFSIQEIGCWIYILCYASRYNSGTFEINFRHAERIARVSKALLESTLNKLELKQIVVIARNAGVTSPSRLGPLRTDGTDVTNGYIAQKDFEREIKREIEQIYLNYPRKEGKKKGMKKLVVRIKTPEDLDNLKISVANYSNLCSLENREPKYIMHWSTFVEEWEDWIKPPPAAVKKEFDIAEIMKQEKEKNERLRIQYEHSKSNQVLSSVQQRASGDSVSENKRT